MMIENTFQIAPGIGAKKERDIWDSGVLTWDDFLDAECVCGMKDEKKRRCNGYLEQAKTLLKDRDSRGLCDLLRKGEEWRLFGDFKEDAAYLDIETDGLDRDSLVTVVTVHRKDRTVTLTHGMDLDSETLQDALDGCGLLVTFNGKCFDIPVLRNSFPNVDLDIPHFDLRYGCAKVGLRGGLKPIERMTGISRDSDILDVDGEEAVRLWKNWARHGDSESLRILTEYNRADTINLETLSGIVYGRLVREYAGFKDL